MRGRAAALGTDGIPAEDAAAVIVEALRVRRPRTRYVIGREAKVQAALARMLPDRAFDALLATRMRKLLNNH
jgi:sirohydrochlorin ferrochelatase